MKTSEIRQRLHDYIHLADDKKIKAIYTMVEGDINEEYDPWSDKEFVAELEKRSDDYKTGKVKAIPWEDVKKRILEQPKRKK